MSKKRDDDLEDIQNGDVKPFYITAIIGCLKVLFFLYDLVIYLPVKIFDDPAKKLEKSRKLKARPENADDPATNWRNIRALKELKATTFEGCNTLGKHWLKCLELYSDLPAMGTREVLKVHKEKQPNGKIFEKWEMGSYHWRTFNEIDRRVNMVASGLKHIGHPDQGSVVLFAETREEWMTTALACFKRAYPIATVYATLGEEAVLFAFKEVAADTIFTSEALLSKVRKAMRNGAKIKNIIYFDSVDPGKKGESIESDDPYTLMSFEQLLAKGEENPLPKVDSISKKEDVAFIMYTSGTTGNPKGVLLTHENVIAAQAGQAECIPVSVGDTYIGYLPLAHILEVCGEIVCLAKGVKIGYSSAQTLFDRAPKILKGQKGDCFVLKPTLMTCVPAVMDRIYKAVVDEVNSQNQLFRELFRTCYERKRSRYEEGYTSYLLNYLVFNKIRVMLGGEVRAVLSGGAPLNPDTQRFMNICFCCPVVQGYGLTETCGGGTCGEIDDISTGYVGAPLSSCVIRLREWKEGGYSPNNEHPQGEILISGKNVTQGYYKNPEKTKEDFIELDGMRYFCTGDIGEFREDGALKIIGSFKK